MYLFVRKVKKRHLLQWTSPFFELIGDWVERYVKVHQASFSSNSDQARAPCQVYGPYLKLSVCFVTSETNGASTLSLYGPCSPGPSCELSLYTSLGAAAAAVAPLDTDAQRSWAEPWCGSVGGDCCWSRCGSHCPGHQRRCPGRRVLQKRKRKCFFF